MPAPLVFGIVDNEGKHALEPTLIQLRVDTRHALPPHSQIEIGVPKQLGLPETDDELSCWVDSSILLKSISGTERAIEGRLRAVSGWPCLPALLSAAPAPTLPRPKCSSASLRIPRSTAAATP